MRSTLKDPALQSRLERDGYVTFPMLSADEVAELKRGYERLGPAPGDPHKACHSSFHSSDEDYKRAVDATVMGVLGPHIESRFDRQRALPSNYIVKWPGGMSGFGLHQDLTLVDESDHRSVEVWVALDDTDETNGQLWMVPGSHTWLPGNIRGIQAFPFPFAGVTRRVIERHSRPVPVRAGEAVVFNHATLHFSMPNRTDRPRMVAIADLIPEEAEHLHFFGDGDGVVEAFSIDDTFWTSNNPFTLWKPPPRSQCLGPLEQASREFTEEDLDRMVAEGRAIDAEGPHPRGAINPGRAWCHRCGSTDVRASAPDRWIGNVTLLCDACRTAEIDAAPSTDHVAPLTPVLDAPELAERGYLTVPVLPGAVVQELRSWFDELSVPTDAPFYVSCNDAERAVARDVDLRLKERLGPVCEQLLPGHVPFLASFVSKGARVEGTMELHQDLTYVDERHHRSVMIWIPLVDVDDGSGALDLIPGSHRWTTELRPGGTAGLPTTPLQDRLAPLGESVAVPAGTAVVFDNALVHGSSGNDTDRVRPAIAIACAPAEATLVHFHREGDGPLRGFEIDEAFFTTQPFRARPEGYPEIEPWDRALEPGDLLQAVDPSAEPTAPTSVAEPRRTLPAMPITPAAAPVEGLMAVPAGPVLTDPVLDQRLRSEGFVTLPLVPAEVAERLRDVYGSLHGWSGSGFEPDLENPDGYYRRAVSAAISGELDREATRHFVAHEPFLRVFLCKWPGGESDLYLHRDWMYVDERRGQRSYVVWVALEDIRGHNGQLRVLRRSHRIDDMLRGTSLEAPWLAHEDVIRERLETVPLRAGEAVVFDNSLVHCSYPNHTDRPRLAAAVGMVPQGAELVYWRREGEGVAARCMVDREFFLTETPSSLIARAPELPVVELAEPGGRELSAEALASLLDRSRPSTAERVQRRLGRLGVRRRGQRPPAAVGSG